MARPLQAVARRPPSGFWYTGMPHASPPHVSQQADPVASEDLCDPGTSMPSGVQPLRDHFEAARTIEVRDEEEDLRILPRRGNAKLLAFGYEGPMRPAVIVGDRVRCDREIAADADVVFSANVDRVLDVADHVIPCWLCPHGEEGHEIDTQNSTAIRHKSDVRVGLVAGTVRERLTA